MNDTSVEICAAYVVICGGYLLLRKTERRKRRRWWMLSLNKTRTLNSGTHMLEKLNAEPSGKFENFCRMSATDFEYLLGKVGQHISKKDTSMRKCIPAQERLAVALRYLATGDSFTSLAYLFKMSNQVVSNIIHEVCVAIIKELKGEIQMPSTPQEWRNLEKEFRERWNYPHCIGAIDGKHIVIQSPLNSGTEFFNYKGTFSVVLMAAVDANYSFIFADIGCQGRISDGGVFANCALSQKINRNELNFPPDEQLPCKSGTVPYVFVADDAFPLQKHIMKPFPGAHDKGSKERFFNYRLSRARRVVENAFGILASVFRVFRKPMLLQPDKVTNITMACVLLHNFLRKSSSRYAPPGTLDSDNEGLLIEGSWRQEHNNMTSLLPLHNIPRKSPTEAKIIREQFADHFITNGKVPWQESCC